MEIKELQFFKDKNIYDCELQDDKYIVNTDSGKYIVEIYEGDLESFLKYNQQNNYLLYELNDKFAKIEDSGFENGYTFVIKKFIQNLTDQISIEKQIQLGSEIGKILRKLHENSQINDDTTWSKIFNYKINNLIYNYSMTNFRGDKDYIVFDYIENNRYLIESRKLSNIYLFDNLESIYADENNLNFVSKNVSYMADSFFEFRKINEADEKNRIFYYSLLKSYFNGKIPRLFYRILAIYTILDILEPKLNGENDVDLTGEFDRILSIYNDFDCIIPVWIKETEGRIRELSDEGKL
ncbi:hypothetical protein GKG03_05960 [Finegoldia sp. BIOML-A3]|uniref:hypothetical protein n=1 Tax=Finegoldia TaxID=150022 RepID=UPI000B91CC4B|nr:MULTISPECIES: hypothetical protein [Finegoldia]MCC2716856.1 hypothetical protein [Finegoldia magna]MDU1579075.1 hypothetical protein [Finegoldia magna]MDU1600924.1 hypothetical protein [Finegoldia magna]MDU4208477.1 hypothetical protein [Finegoldia magna]MSA99231.1 hypothetical protein [Finegoldia sp. BIOML-A3]